MAETLESLEVQVAPPITEAAARYMEQVREATEERAEQDVPPGVMVLDVSIPPGVRERLDTSIQEAMEAWQEHIEEAARSMSAFGRVIQAVAPHVATFEGTSIAELSEDQRRRMVCVLDHAYHYCMPSRRGAYTRGWLRWWRSGIT